MILDIVAGSLNILGWGIKPLYEKMGIAKSSPFIFANIRYIFTAVICMTMLLIQQGNTSFTIDRDIVYYGIIVSVMGIISIMSNYYLLSKYDANYVIGIVEPSVIIITLICGYCFFNEKINLQRVVGILIVCIGIFTIFTSNY
tara:strand:- start:14 stop:442 length:429 start_codon:yes stop_codon:yes gene_type:complete